MSRPFLEFVHPDDLERARTHSPSWLPARTAWIRVPPCLRRRLRSPFRVEHAHGAALGIPYGVARDVTLRAALAEEQAALRRVATLVAAASLRRGLRGGRARGGAAARRRRHAHRALRARRHRDGVGRLGRRRRPLAGRDARSDGGANVVSLVLQRAPRADDSYERAAARSPRGCGTARASVRRWAAPIVVEGRLWGVMVASSKEDEPLPADTESRIAAFTELVATAISNTEARPEARRLADEQAALRRVATLVAHEASPAEVFAAVAAEVARLLEVEDMRWSASRPTRRSPGRGRAGEPDAASRSAPACRWGAQHRSQVLQNGRPARIDDYTRATGAIGATRAPRASAPRSALRSSSTVGSGAPWSSTSPEAESLPADTESRIGEFTELVATAIANIEARSELAASRARIVAAADEERRRVVRDLHDGAQQRLVHTVITLKLPQALRDEDERPRARGARRSTTPSRRPAELRELAHGILPAVLTRGGLRAGVDALASRMPVPVETACPSVGSPPRSRRRHTSSSPRRSPTSPSTRAPKRRGHRARRGRHARVHVRDDGVGGARPDGSGLSG